MLPLMSDRNNYKPRKQQEEIRWDEAAPKNMITQDSDCLKIKRIPFIFYKYSTKAQKTCFCFVFREKVQICITTLPTHVLAQVPENHFKLSKSNKYLLSFFIKLN